MPSPIIVRTPLWSEVIRLQEQAARAIARGHYRAGQQWLSESISLSRELGGY